LLHLLLKFVPAQTTLWLKKRAPIPCPCCGAAMAIIKTRIRSVFSGTFPIPIPTVVVQ
jgi:hypothetical protein